MADHHEPVPPVLLVGPLNVPVLPVCPVEILAQQTEAKGMRKVFISNNFSIRAIDGCHLHPVKLGITPINFLVVTIQSETIGPEHKTQSMIVNVTILNALLTRQAQSL